MILPLLGAGLLALSTPALAQAPDFSELKSQNPVQLSGDELKQLLPGAKVISRTNAGSTRSWENKPDGTLTGSSDGRGSSGGLNRVSAGQGTWLVDAKGRWCVKISWPRNPDDWCRYMFKAGGKYYGYGQLLDKAQGSEFEISR